METKNTSSADCTAVEGSIRDDLDKGERAMTEAHFLSGFDPDPSPDGTPKGGVLRYLDQDGEMREAHLNAEQAARFFAMFDEAWAPIDEETPLVTGSDGPLSAEDAWIDDALLSDEEMECAQYVRVSAHESIFTIRCDLDGMIGVHEMGGTMGIVDPSLYRRVHPEYGTFLGCGIVLDTGIVVDHTYHLPDDVLDAIGKSALSGIEKARREYRARHGKPLRPALQARHRSDGESSRGKIPGGHV